MVEVEKTGTRRETGALVVAVVAAVVALVIGVYHAGDQGPGPFDSAVAHAINDVLPGKPGVLRIFVLPTQPYVLIPAIAIIAGLCAWKRNRLFAVLAILGPALTVSVNTWILKPLFDRYNDGYLAYPSGHTVSLVSVLVVLTLLARKALAALVTTVGVLLLAFAGTGMVGLGYHYATDVIGGLCYATAAVLACYLALLKLTPRPAPAR